MGPAAALHLGPTCSPWCLPTPAVTHVVVYGVEASLTTDSSGNLAGVGTDLMASLHYSSPEVCGLCNGACSQGLLPQPDMLAYDIWALGCVMVFVLTGENAFDSAGTEFSDILVAMEKVDMQHKLWVSFLPWHLIHCCWAVS